MGTQDIRSSIQAATEYLTAHPAEARYTDPAATATLEEGLRVRVSGADDEDVTTDMPTSVGGGATGPSPGWLFRAALASCTATLIAMRAATEGIELRSLEVIVDSESDDRGILGIEASIPAGPLDVSIRVRAAAGEAPGRAVREVIDWGVSHCPVYDATCRAVPVSVEIDEGSTAAS